MVQHPNGDVVLLAHQALNNTYDPWQYFYNLLGRAGTGQGRASRQPLIKTAAEFSSHRKDPPRLITALRLSGNKMLGQQLIERPAEPSLRADDQQQFRR